MSKSKSNKNELNNSLSDYSSKMWKMLAPDKLLKRYQGGDSWRWTSLRPFNTFIIYPPGSGYGYFLIDRFKEAEEMLVKNKSLEEIMKFTDLTAEQIKTAAANLTETEQSKHNKGDG